MGKLNSFTFISLNGFYKDYNNNIDWHHHGDEEAEYSSESLQSDNILLFGRVTYDMMAGFWPSPMAFESFPEVAKGMNDSEKIVISNTLKHADWNNTKVINENMIETIRQLKETSKKDITLLGSGTILTQLSEANLIDEYKIMIDPVVLSNGTSLFHGLQHQLHLKLVSSRTFKSGTILLTYYNK